MKLLEYQGKNLFLKYGIQVPKSRLVNSRTKTVDLIPPFVLKAQVPVGHRYSKGGIVYLDDKRDFLKQKSALLAEKIDGFLPKKILAEEKITPERELYMSFSYDTESRLPVLALSRRGGSGIVNATIFPIDPIIGLRDFYLRDSFLKAQIPLTTQLKQTTKSLWKLFMQENALLTEINPLFVLKDGSCIAADSKVILDDHVVNPSYRPLVDLRGDLAVLASGGGASLINLDALVNCGGRPANYVEYSGNPKASVVEELTIRVLSKSDLKGCWVVGGTANFTDIYETMLGFVLGLRKIKPKPTYPIVIRRDGPRQKEAFEMLKQVAKNENYNFYLFGPETPMSESAKILVKVAYKK